MKRKWLRALILGAPYLISMVGVAFAISPPFSEAWNSTYESIPADTEQESLGASRIRDLKQQLRLRLQQDLSWIGDGNDGFSDKVTLIAQPSDPSSQLDAGATAGILYTKQVGSTDELFYKSNTGAISQLTQGGALISSVPAGTVNYFAGSTPPGGWLLADGSAVSRATYSALYATIGTTYGSGDGSTTFNLPDCRGRFLAGMDTGNSTGRLTGAYTGGLSASAEGNTGGQQAHTLVASEIPTITSTGSTGTGTITADHPVLESFGSNGFVNTSGSGVTSQTNFTVPSLSVQTTSSNTGGAAHNVVPPAIVMACIIKDQ